MNLLQKAFRVQSITLLVQSSFASAFSYKLSLHQAKLLTQSTPVVEGLWLSALSVSVNFQALGIIN